MHVLYCIDVGRPLRGWTLWSKITWITVWLQYYPPHHANSDVSWVFIPVFLHSSVLTSRGSLTMTETPRCHRFTLWCEPNKVPEMSDTFQRWQWNAPIWPWSLFTTPEHPFQNTKPLLWPPCHVPLFCIVLYWIRSSSERVDLVIQDHMDHSLTPVLSTPPRQLGRIMGIHSCFSSV